MPTTGTTLLPDVGALSYNGVTFSCLYKSKAGGVPAPDNAGRTVKCVDWSIDVDSIVTLDAGAKATSIDSQMQTIRQRLSVYGGTLSYQNKGMGANLLINQPGNPVRDVDWGPKTSLIDFQPLGGNLGARILWKVTTRIPELALPTVFQPGIGNLLAVMQFNRETNVTYDDDGYSTRIVKGTLEIPLGRNSVGDRSVSDTVDAYRQQFMTFISSTFDLTRFRVTHREFDVSRDQRTLEWSYSLEELPPMGLPPGCTSARGTMSVRPQKQNFALMPWIVSLRCTYVVRKDEPRRIAWWAFLGLLKFRMEQSRAGGVPPGLNPPILLQNPQPFLNVPARQLEGVSSDDFFRPSMSFSDLYSSFFFALQAKFPDRPNILQQILGQNPLPAPQLMHLGLDEGLYLDSKTISFEASWILNTTVSLILLASGVWKQSGIEGGSAWAVKMADIQGWRSVLANSIDPSADVIVDLGGP